MSEAILDIYENVSTQNNKTAPLLSLKHISYSYNTPKAEIVVKKVLGIMV